MKPLAPLSFGATIELERTAVDPLQQALELRGIANGVEARIDSQQNQPNIVLLPAFMERLQREIVSASPHTNNALPVGRDVSALGHFLDLLECPLGFLWLAG